MSDDRSKSPEPGVEEAAPDAPRQPDEGARAREPRITDKRRVHDPFVGEEEETSARPEDEDAEQLKAQAAQYLDDLRRLKAEFENYRKRVIKEQTALIETATAALVEHLLPVLDDFELALIAADRTKDYEALVRGVELVFSKLAEVLHKQGLTKIDAAGQPFDPQMHEAVMQEEGSDEGKPVVGEVFRTGYTLGGRVIRPAMVKVKRER